MSSAATAIAPPVEVFTPWRDQAAKTEPDQPTGQEREPYYLFALPSFATSALPGSSSAYNETALPYRFKPENAAPQHAHSSLYRFGLEPPKKDVGRQGLILLDGPFLELAAVESFDARVPHTLPTLLNLLVASGANSEGITFSEPEETAGAENISADPEWLEPLRAKIIRLSLLPNNWDSYRAKPINRDTIKRATHVGDLLAHVVSRSGRDLDAPPSVSPTSSSGISFETRCRDRELQIEIPDRWQGDYEVLKVSHDPAGREIEEEYSVHESQLREVLAWIVQGS